MLALILSYFAIATGSPCLESAPSERLHGSNRLLLRPTPICRGFPNFAFRSPGRGVAGNVSTCYTRPG